MSAYALVIDIDGTLEEVTLPAAEASSLNAMYKAIDCHSVEAVRLTDQLVMWLDEEGLYTAPFNFVATALASMYGYTHQGYHGRALITGVNAEGDTVNLTQDQANTVRDQLGWIQRWRETRDARQG